MTDALNTTSKELFNQFEWFNQVFNNAVQAGSDDFLYSGIRFKLYAVGKNLDTMSEDESYFVTKVKIDPQNEIYIRNSDKAVNTILTKALGPNKKFDINKITELEAKLITAFNDNLYNFMSNAFMPSAQQSRKFDLTHLTFFIKDEDTNLSGKMIISFPGQIVDPQNIISQEDKFSYDFFENSLVEVNIKIGTTVFTVGDMKALEPEDIILLENSNIQTMSVNYKNDYIKDFRITPNPALIISVDNSGGEEMSSNMPSSNLWDSIQVEMSAEFDKVKITLGELKNVEQGLVVDISSVYNNNITLKVEEKVIATGELVIINDRYGVKINKIYAEEKPVVAAQETVPAQQLPPQDYAQGMPPQEMVGEQIGESIPQSAEGDFDYSDFDLEDEDL